MRVGVDNNSIYLEDVDVFSLGSLLAFDDNGDVSIVSKQFSEIKLVNRLPFDEVLDSSGSELAGSLVNTIDALNLLFRYKDTDGKVGLIELSGSQFAINTVGNNYLTVLNESIALLRGKYRVQIEYKWALDSTTQDFLSKLFIDGIEPYVSILPELHRQEGKDSGGGNLNGSGTNQINQPFNESFYIELATDRVGASSMPFIFQIAPSGGGIEATVYFPKIQIFATN